MNWKIGLAGTLLISLGIMMIPNRASALSCARPDLLQTLEKAKASETTYHILVGRFVMQTPLRKHPENSNGGLISQHQPSSAQASIINRSYFEGVSLATKPRHDYLLSRFPVDIETSCVGPWCSSVPGSGQELIAFVEAREGMPPILKIPPCSSTTFAAEEAKVKKIRQCLDKDCAR